MTRYDVDLFVLGGGSGGVRVARVAAGHGARVAIAEAKRWGGTCVVRGCVPKKLMVYASEVSRQLDDARGQGWTVPDVTFNWGAFIAAKDKEIDRLSTIYVERLKHAGVRVFEGEARIADPHTIEVNSERLTAANIVVATGGAPKLPPPKSGPAWISSDEAFHLPELPKRIAILGAGYIAIEFAHIFRGFGSQVTLVHRGGILRGFDPDLAAEVQRGLDQHGIATLHGDLATVEHDVAMAAIGRAPVTPAGTAEAGVVLDKHGGVAVDEWSRSNIEHIYAIGDVTSRVALTPVAIREGQALADTLFGGIPTPMKHELIPSAIFAQPPAAAIGFTEPAACEKHDITVFRARFRPMRYALSGRDEHVLIKLIIDRTTDRVLGLHVVGPDAPEIVQAAAIAVTMGATKADFDRTFALHPTTAEELVLMR